VGSSVVETIMLNANAEFEVQLAQARLHAEKPPARNPSPLIVFVKPGAEITDAHMAAPIRGAFQRQVRRLPTEEETAKYIDFLKKNLAETSDPVRSLRATLTSIYLSPEAIYRMEWGLGKTDEHGRRMLSPGEVSDALSYALFDNNRGFTKALREGKLSTREDIARVVDEMISTPEHELSVVPGVMRFIHEFFGYHRAGEVFKDQRRVNEHGLFHQPINLVREADSLIKVILSDDKNVFERMLTTNEALVFHNGRNQGYIDSHKSQIAGLKLWDQARVDKEIAVHIRTAMTHRKFTGNPPRQKARLAELERLRKTMLARKKAELAQMLKAGGPERSFYGRDARYLGFYNLSTRDWKWPAKQPFRLPADQRAGILAHPAWLVAHSGNDNTDPIHRGIWVYEKLLAGVIADVPPDVDAKVPEDPHKTLRQRLVLLRDKSCWKCHIKINPLGEAFEMYDDFGRFRTKHYFDENKEIDTRVAKHVPDENGVDQVRGFDRDKLVAEGEYSTRLVDATGSFDGLGIPELSGDFKNAIEMIHTIAKTDRARQSIIRHLFRYLLGRNEMLSDSQTLINADQAYLKCGGSFKAVVVSLLSSDSFLYRK
jgi:hypothetical protein